jgi:RNA polymerase sigma factor (TIGR02999 family)
MPASDGSDTTALLAAARDGDRAAYDRVFARVYEELRRVASRQSARFGGRADSATISTTALVHEAYLKLTRDQIVAGKDRIHFFALASRAMRQILLDHARHGSRRKRGGDVAKVELDGLAFELSSPEGEAAVHDLLALDRALERLSGVDPELARLVEWRFFAGLTLPEIVELTGSSERTLKRDWVVARAFLARELGGEAGQAGEAPSGEPGG